MAHAFHHAQSSARRHGGKPEDYIALHDWFDATKEMFADFRHRALRHHSHGIFEAERVFGHTIVNAEGKPVPVRILGEQHIMEDFSGFIPTVQDWLKHLSKEPWMQPNSGYQRQLMASIRL